jgi:hypothetical protein
MENGQRHKICKDQRDPQVQMEVMARMVQMEKQLVMHHLQLAPQVRKERKAQLVRKVLQVHKVHKVQRDPLVQLVRKVLQVLQVHLDQVVEHRDQQVRKVQQVQQD